MAKSERSIEVFAAQQKTTETFDYFVCGVAGAIFAYIVKDYSPQKLAWDWSLLTPAALMLLAFSFFAGLKRIEATAGCARINAVQLDASERATHLTTILMNPQNGPPFDSETGQFESMESVARRRDDYLLDVSAATSVLESGLDKTALYCKLRNAFLVLGFITILCAKIAQPYARGVSAEKTIAPEIKKLMQPLSPVTNLSGPTNR